MILKLATVLTAAVAVVAVGAEEILARNKPTPRSNSNNFSSLSHVGRHELRPDGSVAFDWVGTGVAFELVPGEATSVCADLEVVGR